MDDLKFLSRIETSQLVAALLVAIGVGWEFLGSIIAKPVRERVDRIRELHIKELETAGKVASIKSAELEKEAAIARLETEQLKASMAWRRLSPQQHDKLVALLKGKISGKVWVECPGEDPEASQFHNDIFEALKDAGISVQWYSGWGRIYGLQITQSTSSEGAILKHSFQSVGLHFEPSLGPKMGTHVTDLEIIIGSKPPSLFVSAAPKSNEPSK